MGPLSPGHESRSASAEISGVSGRIRRMGRTTNPLIDAIAAARWVPRLRRDTVIASSCISVPRPVVHRSRGTRPGRRRPRAIQLSASPYPGLVSTRPRSGKIPGRMSPQPTGLGDSTESERESEDLGVVVIVDVKLPAIFPAKMEFLRVWRKGRIEGPYLALSSPHPRASILQGSQSPKHSTLNPHFLVRQDQSPVAERKCPVSHRHTVPCREIFPSAAQPPPHSASTSADQVGNPISNLAKHLDPSPAWPEMSMNAKPWKLRSFSLRVSLTVLPLRWS